MLIFETQQIALPVLDTVYDMLVILSKHFKTEDKRGNVVKENQEYIEE